MIINDLNYCEDLKSVEEKIVGGIDLIVPVGPIRWSWKCPRFVEIDFQTEITAYSTDEVYISKGCHLVGEQDTIIFSVD